MIDEGLLKKKLAHFSKTKEADKLGIIFFHSSLQVSRFANSQIHQHMNDEDQVIYFRVLVDGRIGIASTNSLDAQNMQDTFKKALSIAKLKLNVKEKKDIPCFRPLKTARQFYFPETANMSASLRVKMLQSVFKPAEILKIKFSGNFYNGAAQIMVISPEGNINHQSYSFAGIKLIATSKDASGYAASASYDADTLGAKNISDTAVKKCLQSNEAITLKPSRYDVILEPAAVAEIILWLNYIGFGAKSVFEESSFLYNKVGRKITGEKVSIYDFGLDKNTFIFPFDFEGLPRRKACLIKKGVAGKPLCDTYYAKLLKMKSTGHANFPDDTDGPLGYNLIMEGGDIPQDKIIESAKQAVLITRFHYINGYLDTHQALMTGMTRDGTFLIENGKIKSAVKNMRFTESILEAFKRIKYISKERKIISDHLESLCSITAPALYIKDFNFSS